MLDIAFSPSQESFRLATCSSDGLIRIYEALEPTNLTLWSQMEEVEVSTIGFGTAELKGLSLNPTSQQPSTSQQQQQQQPTSQLQQQLQQHQQSLQGLPPLPQTPLYQQSFQQQLQQPSMMGGASQQQQQQQQQASIPFQPYLQQPSMMGGSSQQQQQQQPVHTNSTSSSNSSLASHGLSTPGMNEVMNHQGVSPGSSTGIAAPIGGNVASVHRPVDADSGFCIDWCPNRSPTAMMVVGLGKEIGARVSCIKYWERILTNGYPDIQT